MLEIIKRLKEKYFSNRKFLIYKIYDGIGIELVSDSRVILFGKEWLTYKHSDVYNLFEKYCIEKNIGIIELHKANITSKLVSKLENLYRNKKSVITLIIRKEQAPLLRLLTERYTFILLEAERLK